PNKRNCKTDFPAALSSSSCRKPSPQRARPRCWRWPITTKPWHNWPLPKAKLSTATASRSSSPNQVLLILTLLFDTIEPGWSRRADGLGVRTFPAGAYRRDHIVIGRAILQSAVSVVRSRRARQDYI